MDCEASSHQQWRQAELALIDRSLDFVEESFAMVVTFLAKNPDAAALHAEALFLARRTRALRTKCAQLHD